MTTIFYQYIANSNEYAARAICSKYGFDLQNAENANDVGICLEKVMEAIHPDEAEAAMLDILALHPDKDIILETFGNSQAPEKKCGCTKNKKSKLEAFIPQPASSIKNHEVMIFAGALLIAAAIISKS